jgi:flagellar hook-length control protein FliK
VTAFPALPNQPLLKEGVLSGEAVSRRENPGSRDFLPIKETEKRPGESLPAKEPSRSEDGVSSFRKIFQEKKAEREAAEPARTGVPENGAHGKEKIPTKTDIAKRAVKEAAKRTAGLQAAKKPSTWKDILAELIDKNANTGQTGRDRKTESKKTDRKTEALNGERLLSLRDGLEHAKTDALTVMKQALSKAASEKPTRQVLIIDLRDRAVEKSKAAEPSPKAPAGQPVAKNEPRQTKRPADAKDAFETKVLYKPGALPDRPDSLSRPAGGEAARATSDFSTRMAEVMKNEIVRHAGLVLKNNGNGEIHLVLKPESLGSVRIKLNLEDNHIVGKIIVDNNTVKQIMEENLGHLETALQQNGYETAAFDVSVAGEKKNAPEESAFSGLIDDEPGNDPLPVREYEAGGASLYADSLVNIVW